MQNEITNTIQIAKEQNNFLETTIGKLINTGINTGLRVLLPDLIEDQIISIKDEIIKNGFKAGIQQTVSSAIELGKSVVGMVTGKFDNINQAQTVIKSGGLIDTVSNLLDKGINTTIKNNIISTNVGKVIKRGKNTILNTISNNIENNFTSQINNIEKINKYSNNWNNYYKNKDLDGMEREYKKIKEKLKETMPLEKTIIDARKIENIHKLIKNNRGNFNLSAEEIGLAQKLIY